MTRRKPGFDQSIGRHHRGAVKVERSLVSQRGGLRRFPDWPTRLADYLAAAESVPWAWGRHDCALFACDCMRAVTGFDPGAEFRGRYTTRRGAELALRRRAGGGLLEVAIALALEHKAAEVGVAFAKRGDLLYGEDENGGYLGIVIGRGDMVRAADPEGYDRRPVTEARRAWSIG